MAKTDYKDFFKNVKWGKVAIYGVVAIGMIFLFHVLFRKGGILSRGIGVIESTTGWGQDQVGKGLDLIIDSSEKSFDLIEKGTRSLWEWWTDTGVDPPDDAIDPDK